MVDAVEALDDGVCVAKRGGRVLYQNEAFRRLLATGSEAGPLKEAIRDAQRSAVGRMDDRHHSDSPRPSASRATNFAVETHTGPMRLRVRCTVIRHLAERPHRSETIVIWVRPFASHCLSPTELRRRYGLTAREGRVATLVEAGARTREIAHTLGISIHTARRHAEAVLRKLGVHSRMEVRERMQSHE